MSTRNREAEAAAAELDEDTSLFPAVKRARTEPEAPPAAQTDGPPPTEAGLLRQVVAALGALAAGGDLGTLQTFIAQLAPAVLADIVLNNLQYLSPIPPVDPRYAAGQAPAPGLLDLLAPVALTQAPAPARDGDVRMAEAAEAAPAAPLPAAAQPAPLVAVALSGEERAAQRRAAVDRILHAEQRSLVSGV